MTARFKTYSFSFDSDLPLDERAKNIEPTERIFELRDSGAVPISGPLSPIPDNDEGAARFYLDRLLGEVVEDDVVPVLDPETPALVPGLLMARLEDTGALGVKTVHFTQVSRSIPIFGTNAVVEIEASSKKLVSFDAQLSNVPDVSHMPEMSAQQCYAQLRNFVDRTLPEQPGRSPKLCFFAYEDGDDWYLVYHFEDVPALPVEVKGATDEGGKIGGSVHCHSHALSPRQFQPSYNFLIDAHSGQLIYSFSGQPLLDLPVLCKGLDDAGTQRDFQGFQAPSDFQLYDPQRNILTFDLGSNDIATTSPPADPISNASTDFASSTPAGISAHFYATQVFDFFNGVLKRKGIDDKGMKLESVVNCWYSPHGPGPSWPNAVWWNNKMWYGQEVSGGTTTSFARYLDIIAHELTHGVTETTSDLIYRDESGALNESFSDIFGVIVANWYPNEPNPVSSWNWEIGSGLGHGGGPMRDMSDPTRTGDPDHWRDNKHIGTSYDNGGVHINSNIHNKAAYNVLTSQDAAGNSILTPVEVAQFYYLTLLRLGRRATFSDCRRNLLKVANHYFQGVPGKRLAVNTAISDAYDAVGIL